MAARPTVARTMMRDESPGDAATATIRSTAAAGAAAVGAQRDAGRIADGDTATLNLQVAPGGMTTRRSAPPCASRAARTGNPTSPCSAGGARTPRSARRPPR
jgi:hypothetical protein